MNIEVDVKQHYISESVKVKTTKSNLFLFDCETSNCYAYVNHARIRSWNQPVLSNENKVSCSRKQRGPLMGLEFTTDRYPPITRRATYCDTPPLKSVILVPLLVLVY